MTREAVEEGFEYFLDEVVEASMEEFSVSRAVLDGARGPGGAMVDTLLRRSETLHRRVVRPELESYRRRTVEQFGLVLDCVENGETVEDNRERVLEAGVVADSIRDDVPRDRRERVTDDLLAHHRALGRAVEPLLDSPESAFWAAATSELSRAEAETLVGEQFAFTGPLRAHRDALEMVTTVDPVEVVGPVARLTGPDPSFDVEYTDEAIRALYHAQRAVTADAEREIDRRFG